MFLYPGYLSSDNLAIALHDRATVMAIVDARHTARQRTGQRQGVTNEPIGSTATTVQP